MGFASQRYDKLRVLLLVLIPGVSATSSQQLVESRDVCSLLMSFLAVSICSRNGDDNNYKGYFGGVGLGYSVNTHHSFRVMTYIQDNNAYIDEADKRFLLAYKYQF